MVTLGWYAWLGASDMHIGIAGTGWNRCGKDGWEALRVDFQVYVHGEAYIGGMHGIWFWMRDLWFDGLRAMMRFFGYLFTQLQDQTHSSEIDVLARIPW